MSASLALGLANMGTTGLKAYNDGVDKNRRQEKEDAEIAWQNEQRAAIREDRAQKQQLKTSLAAAARPAQVDAGYQVTDDAGSNAFTKDADAAAVMGDMVADQRPSLASATRVQDTAYRDPKQAQAAEQQYNSTPATLGRMSEAAMPIDAERGLKLADSASTAAKTQKALKDEEIAQVNELFNRQILSIASSGPDWSARAAEALTKSNAPGLQGMQVEPALSQDGKTVSFKIVLPSGETKIVGSYENSERGAEQWVRDSARVDFNTKLGWLNENMKHERELEKIAARDKGDKAPSGYRFTPDGGLQAIPGGPGDKRDGTSAISREERLRYTSLFSDAGRRQSEAQKTLNTLLKERAYANAKPGTPQHEELQSIRDAIKQYGEERKTYQSMLAEGAGAKGPGLGSAKAPNASERDMAKQVQGDMGADPAMIRREISAATADIAKVPDQASKQMLADHVANMQRQLANIEGAGLSSAQQPARQVGPVTVTTAAEHAALPKGTRYTAPDGSVRIKQ
ncbi:hypothetical protein KBW71_03185 [Hydrogenophaga aromaticivorans]|uniref:hypothetical protein n=1 Tax=Hydrogenophaga aromaticivorans TaxID=2610898 RepID=UPI001B36EFB6|nr:hypothetical protein [Hydrogenophaga aromaticivorans]MBQ0917432.1 hypothetical protein [Hydrogenophaga aromaticivorans]